MQLTQLISQELIRMELQGTNKEDIIEEMAHLIEQSGALSDKEAFKEAVFLREAEGSTGIGFGIAIPHGKSEAVKTAKVAFGIKRDGVDWDSLDGERAKLIFMIAVPEKNAGDEHLKILQWLSRKLIDDDFREALLQTATKEDVIKLLESQRG